jgi:hypothetical protein
MTHALWMMKARLIKTSIDQTHFRAADRSHAFFRFFIDYNKSIVAGI